MSESAPRAPALPKFAIVTLPRSGSYHLVSLLNSAPDIVCHGEVFKKDYVELSKVHLTKMKVDTKDAAERDANAVQFLQRLRALNAKKVFGFKMFPEHYRRVPALDAHVVKNQAWRKIFLLRNPIESYASLLRAQRTGIWTMEDAKRTDAPPERLNMPVTFDPASFKEHAKLCSWFEGLYTSTAAIADNKCFRLDYVNVNDPATLDAALAFVGSTSTHKDLESQREKQFSGQVRDGFANWKELTIFARKNGHGAWVDAAEKI
jgi:hypothetical protein